MYNSNNILLKIELLRQKMAEVALHTGLTSKESISISQELDQLLNFYETAQKLEKTESRKKTVLNI